ncbi:hypothetical protein PBRA_003192 [Plasmodiophora brassicae]|nr:hypothetical protein PBRA_003192 [Plasmodiophora brassicae]
MTALQMAAARAHVAIVQDLLEAGADPNAAQKSSRLTALHHAANSQRHEAAAVIRAVVEYGADPNAVDGDGLSSLHYACTRGNLPCVEALCQAGADPNIETCPMTPLMMAAAQGHDQVVQALVKCGATVNGKTRAKGQTVLHIACEHERFSTVDILLANGASTNEVDAEGASALIGAISRGQPQMVIHLLNHHAIPDRTSLHVAAKLGYVDIMQELLRRNVVWIDEREPGSERTALMVAACTGQLGAVALLIESGADKNLIDRNGERFSVSAGHHETHTSSSGHTALTIATKAGQQAARDMLRASGARSSRKRRTLSALLCTVPRNAPKSSR